MVTREGSNGAGGRPAVSRRTVAFVLGVFGIAGPQVASEPPHGWGAWLLLIAAAMAGAMLATGLISTVLDPPPGPRPDPPPGPRPPRLAGLRRVLLPIGVLGIAVTVGTGTAIGIGEIRSIMRGCTTPVEVPVVAGPETVETANALARQFELATARARRDCPTASLSVYSADAIAVRDGLLAGWQVRDTDEASDLNYLRDLGPRPQIWMPDSTADVDRLPASSNRNDTSEPLGAPTIYGWSPLVLAVPIGSPEVPPASTWPELLQAYAGRDFNVVRPDSRTSFTGQLALTSTYPQSWEGSDLRVARRIDEIVTSGQQQAGYPLGDAAALLRQFQRNGCGAAPLTALVLPEQFAFQPGRAGQQVRDDLGCSLDPRRLRAFTPQNNTAIINRPVIPLSWEDGDGNEPAARTAVQFIRWLHGEAGRAAIEATGLNAGDHRAPEVRRPDRGTSRLDPTLVEAIDSAVERHAAISRPAHLLLAIDTSGSMATRIELATTLLEGTADRLGDEDRLGLMTFGGSGAEVLVKFRPAGDPAEGAKGWVKPGATSREAVRSALSRLRPEGGTPLKKALAVGVSTLLTPVQESSTESEPIKVMVVVTDGRDTAGGPDPVAVADRARQGGVRVFVVAAGSIDCRLPILATVTARSGGECQVARNSPEASADALAAEIWSAGND